MKRIEVKVLSEGSSNPEGQMMFLAKLTQRGHNISNMADLTKMYNDCMEKTDWQTSKRVAQLPHGTIKRTTPVMIAIVGASRRFLAQIRTHGPGLTFVSASLQYSDYSEVKHVPTLKRFSVPFAFIRKGQQAVDMYLAKCQVDSTEYAAWIEAGIDNDSAGYLMPQGMRNILVISGNYEAWDNLINKRSCRRNTEETQYVSGLIWKALYESTAGDVFFEKSGPDCVGRGCREGHMCCGKPYKHGLLPDAMIEENWSDVLCLK